MAGPWRRWRCAALVALAGMLATGCNLLSLPYFLMMGSEAKKPPGLMKLASEDPDKEVKVVILVYSGLETRLEFVTVDRELSTLLGRHLMQGCNENKEKVTVVSTTKVQEYKNNHPDWHNRPLQYVGKHFSADHVIYLEIRSLSLYERGSANQLYRGRADIAVTLVNMNHPEEDPVEKSFSCEYPNSRGPVPVEDQNPQSFYLAFMSYMAQRLSWYFTAHPFEKELCN